jgi:hypothetical protein
MQDVCASANRMTLARSRMELLASAHRCVGAGAGDGGQFFNNLAFTGQYEPVLAARLISLGLRSVSPRTNPRSRRLDEESQNP